MDLVVRPAAEAFLEVGVFVAVMLAAFGLIQWATGGRAERWLAHHRHLGPVAGAALGVVPGCGGAIVVMPLYTRGAVSFGTVVAALVATMGDSSFVLLAAEPATAAALHGVLFVVGAACGTLVDLAGFTPRTEPAPRAEPIAPVAPRPVRSTVGAAAAELGLTGRTLAVRSPSPALLGFWGLVLGGLVVAVPHVGQFLPEGGWYGVDPVLAVGTPGALVMVSLALLGRHADGGPAPTTAWGVLRSCARETASVTSWVILAFVVFEAVLLVPALDPGALPAVGIPGVLAGALVGLAPSCGPQILLTGLYTQGAVPLAMLVANALSQDGDALLPLLTMDRRSALAAAAITTIPGVSIGLAILGLGW